MPSPFPGMDPYLEPHWGDVHQGFVIYARDQIQGRLPKGLVARVEERVTLESAAEDDNVLVPDIRVIKRRRAQAKESRAGGGLAVAEPLIIPLNESPTEGYIEILDAASGHKIITVIEVLSRSNKLPGAAPDEYRKKQRELRDGHVSLVEIDLLRAGRRPLLFRLDQLPSPHGTPYMVVVHRGWRLSHNEVFCIALRQRLPVVPIPLRKTDADVPLDLQAVIDQCYRNGAYEADLDYEADPTPPLEPEDAEWADALLREQGKRKRRRSPRRPQRRGRRRKR